MVDRVDGQHGNARGKRAEDVAQWYFRLNGFLLIPAFVVHPDREERYARTDADILGVRFPYSSERIGARTMDDDPRLVAMANPPQATLVMAEAKSTGGSSINGPWTTRERGNMQRAIRRLGFATESMVEEIAETMYTSLRWENSSYVLQYICIAEMPSSDYARRYEKLVQVTWNDIADFLFARFKAFPEKLPTGETVHRQWPRFGRKFGRCSRFMQSCSDAREFVTDYIQNDVTNCQ